MAQNAIPTDDDSTPEHPNFNEEIQEALHRATDDGSHVERDAETIHPSQLASPCRRQAYVSKFGLKDQSEWLGALHGGTLIHEFLEESLREKYADTDRNLRFEMPAECELDGINIVGTADCYDADHGVIYDYKTRAGLSYKFNPPKESHVDQIQLYMAATGARRAQLVYISRKDLSETYRWPADDEDEEREFILYDPERVSYLLDRAKDIRDAVQEHGIAEAPEEIPFEKCGCWFCETETLAFGGDE